MWYTWLVKEWVMNQDYSRQLAEIAVKNFIKHKNLDVCIDNQSIRKSWDGEILLYENENRNKNNYSELKIQIKGFSGKIDENYQIDLEDLGNYLNDGGVIYFVGFHEQVDDVLAPSTKLFYSILSQSDLKLAKQNNGKIKLKPADNINQFYEEVFNFNQLKIISIGRSEIAENELKKIKSFNFTIPAGYDCNSFMKSGEHTVKVKLQDDQERFISRVRMYEGITKKADVCVNNVRYFEEYSELTNDDYFVIKCKNDLTITCDLRNKNINISVNLCTDIDGAVTNLTFFNEFLKHKVIVFGKRKLDFTNMLDENELKNQLNRNAHLLYNLRRLQFVLDALDCKEIFSYEEYCKEDIETVENLLNNKIDNIDDKKVAIKLFGKNLLVCYEYKENKLLLGSYFSNRVYLITEEKTIIPLFCTLNFLDFKNFYFNIENLLNSCYTFNPNKKSIGFFYQFGLNLIRYIDVYSNKSYIKEVMEFWDWLCSKDEDNEISYFNYLQTKKRMSKINSEEKKWCKSNLNKTEDVSKKIMYLILLDEYEHVRELLNKLSPEEFKSLETLPIYDLYKKTTK